MATAPKTIWSNQSAQRAGSVARVVGTRGNAKILIDEFRVRSIPSRRFEVRVKFGTGRLHAVKPRDDKYYLTLVAAKRAGTAFAKKGRPMISKSRKRAEAIRRAYARIPR